MKIHSFYLPDQMAKEIKILALQTGIKKSQIIRDAIKEFLKANSQERYFLK